MGAKQTDVDFKVGIFVTVGLVLVMIAVLVLGSTESLLTRKNRYSTHFQSVDGLIQGAKVTIGGVPVGVIESIEFDQKARDVVATYSVKRSSAEWVRRDSTVEVTTLGMLGDKYIVINAGSPDMETLPSGSQIPYRAGKDLSQFLSKGDTLMVSLNSIALSLDRILKTFDSGNRSETFFSGLAATSKNLSLITTRLNDQLDKMQIKSAVNSLDSILDKINNGEGTVGALINDPGLYDDLKSLLGGANRSRVVRNLVRQSVKARPAEAAPEEPTPAPSK